MKTAASQHSAELLADFEQQLASIYSWDQDGVWKQAPVAAAAAVAVAKQNDCGALRIAWYPGAVRTDR